MAFQPASCCRRACRAGVQAGVQAGMQAGLPSGKQGWQEKFCLQNILPGFIHYISVSA